MLFKFSYPSNKYSEVISMSRFMRLRDYILYTSTTNTIVQSVFIHDKENSDIILEDGSSLKDIIGTILKPSTGDLTAVINQAIVNQAIAV